MFKEYMTRFVIFLIPSIILYIMLTPVYQSIQKGEAAFKKSPFKKGQMVRIKVNEEKATILSMFVSTRDYSRTYNVRTEKLLTVELQESELKEDKNVK